jgi:hypothetical protein
VWLFFVFLSLPFRSSNKAAHTQHSFRRKNQQQQQRPEFYETRRKRTARTAEKKVAEKFLADSFSLSLDANVLRWGTGLGYE